MSKVMSSDTSKSKEETPSPASSSPKTPSKRTAKKKQSPSRVQHISLYRNHHDMIIERSEDEGVERDGQTPPPTGTRRKTPSGDSTRSKDRDSTYSSGSSAGSSRRSTPQRQLSGSPSQSPARFQSYMSLHSVQKGLKKGELIEGMLRINPKNYEDSYITAPDGEMDIYIMGVHDRNRALQGDAVVVRLNPLYKSKVLKDVLLDFLIGTATLEDFLIFYDDYEVAQAMFRQLKSFDGIYSAAIPKVTRPEGGTPKQRRRSENRRRSNSNLEVIREDDEKKRGRRRKRGVKKRTKEEEGTEAQTQKSECSIGETEGDVKELSFHNESVGEKVQEIRMKKWKEKTDEGGGQGIKDRAVLSAGVTNDDDGESPTDDRGSKKQKKDRRRNRRKFEKRKNSQEKSGSDICSKDLPSETELAIPSSELICDPDNEKIVCEGNGKSNSNCTSVNVEKISGNSSCSFTDTMLVEDSSSLVKLDEEQDCTRDLPESSETQSSKSVDEPPNATAVQISNVSAKDVEIQSANPVSSETSAKHLLPVHSRKPSKDKPAKSAVQIVPLHELLECEDYDEFCADTASDMESQTSELEDENLLASPLDLNESLRPEDTPAVIDDLSTKNDPQDVEKMSSEICDDNFGSAEETSGGICGFERISKSSETESISKIDGPGSGRIKEITLEAETLSSSRVNFEEPESSNKVTESSDDSKCRRPEVHPSHLQPNDIPSDNHLKHEHSHDIPKATNPSCTNASVDVVNSAKETQPLPVQKCTMLQVEENIHEMFDEINDSSSVGKASGVTDEKNFSSDDDIATKDQTPSSVSKASGVTDEKHFSSYDDIAIKDQTPSESNSSEKSVAKNKGRFVEDKACSKKDVLKKSKNKDNFAKGKSNPEKNRSASQSDKDTFGKDKGDSGRGKGSCTSESDKGSGKAKVNSDQKKRRNSIDKFQKYSEKEECRNTAESGKGASEKGKSSSEKKKRRNKSESDKDTEKTERYLEKSKRRNSVEFSRNDSGKERSSSEKEETKLPKGNPKRKRIFQKGRKFYRRSSFEKNEGGAETPNGYYDSCPANDATNEIDDAPERRHPWRNPRPVTAKTINEIFKKFFKFLEEREEKSTYVIKDRSEVVPENQEDFPDIVHECPVQPSQGLSKVEEEPSTSTKHLLMMDSLEQNKDETKDNAESCKVPDCVSTGSRKGNMEDEIDDQAEEQLITQVNKMGLEENEDKQTLKNSEESHRLIGDEVIDMYDDGLENSLDTPIKTQDDEGEMDDGDLLLDDTAEVMEADADASYQDLEASMEEGVLKDEDGDRGQQKGIKKRRCKKRGYGGALAGYTDIPLFLTPQQIAKHPEAQKFLQRTGHVVYILERKHSRLAVGRLKTFLSKDSDLALFSPTDSCVPRMKIPIKQCPDDFLKSPEAYETTLFLAQIAEWDVVPFADGKLVTCLGDTKNIDVATQAILLDYNFDAKNIDTPEYVEELQQVPFAIPEEEVEARKDYRQDCIFTIDPSTARDLDDAVSCEEIGPEEYILAIHIADVSHFLKEGTRADVTASERATSVYMVNMVLPMLPRHLCENLCSLNPGEDKLSFSVELEVNMNGVFLGEPWIGRSIINSCCKLSYDHAQLMIEKELDDLDETMFPVIYGGFKLKDLHKKVRMLHDLTKNLREKRDVAGRLRLDQPRLAFHLNESMTVPTSFYPYTIKESNKLIEELMLLANTCVAEFLHKNYPKLAVLRGHPHPRRRLLEDTVDVLEKYGIFLKAESSGSLNQSLQRYLGKDFHSRARYQALVNMLARPMVPARYMCSGSVQEFEEFHHYALNLDLYTHFTSPIRRYADVLVHRLLSSALQYTEEPSLTTKYIHKLTAHCNDRKMAARYAQEKSTDLFLGHFIQDVPQQCWCIVVSVASNAFDVLFWEMGNVVKRVYINKSNVQSAVYHRDHGNSKLVLKWECEEESRIYTQEICLLVVLRAELSFIQGSGLLVTAIAPHKWPPMPSAGTSSS